MKTYTYKLLMLETISEVLSRNYAKHQKIKRRITDLVKTLKSNKQSMNRVKRDARRYEFALEIHKDFHKIWRARKFLINELTNSMFKSKMHKIVNPELNRLFSTVDNDNFNAH
jgi:Txe/YoeB family toxin of Txe-Axe toxin-antitoxin module